MLREDKKAKIIPLDEKILIPKDSSFIDERFDMEAYYLYTAKFTTMERVDNYLGVFLRYEKVGPTWTEDSYEKMMKAQEDRPILLTEFEERRYWIFLNRIFWEDEQHNPEDVKALVLDRIRKKEKQLQRAHVAANLTKSTPSENGNRERIPDEVRIFVWNRDGGQCTLCGVRKNLEFDHIIPISKGGANTARNLQLLCETCNREKGAELS